jgi:hypothetical protein
LFSSTARGDALLARNNLEIADIADMVTFSHAAFRAHPNGDHISDNMVNILKAGAVLESTLG